MAADFTTPADARDALRANGDAWFADDIDRPTFDANQRTIWTAIHDRGDDFIDQVEALLREDLAAGR